MKRKEGDFIICSSVKLLSLTFCSAFCIFSKTLIETGNGSYEGASEKSQFSAKHFARFFIFERDCAAFTLVTHISLT